MSKHVRRLVLLGLGAAIVALGLGTVGLKLILDYSARHAPARPQGFVPARFHQVKDSPGHLDHYDYFACRECHPAGADAFQRPGPELCDECHDEQRVIFHDSPLARDTTDCLSCHRFGDDRQVAPHNCMRCHGLRRGYVSPIEVHAGAVCTDCHRVHEQAPVAQRECSDCHREQHARHGERPPEQARTCLDCHRVHDAAKAADQRCAECHTTRRPTVSSNALFDGHPQCVTCHRPHDFTAAGARVCRDCHYDANVLAAGTVRSHAECTRCHWPHDVTRQASRSCERCHRGVSPDHPPDAQRGPCLGCHPAHPDRPLHAGAATCWSCHSAATSATSFHDARGGKTPCARCHPTHRFASAKASAAFCGDCHADQAKRARLTAGHDQCLGCHEGAWHAPAGPRPGCAQCHAAQAASAPSGHADCARCHRGAHDARPDRKATCQTCHAAQAAANLHGKVAGGCIGCHRAHGPRGIATPPSCAACHDRAELPGLHAVDQHGGSCERCHPPHEVEARRDRKACTGTCHAAQRNHEPTARLCSGCHPFRGDGRIKARRSPR